MIQFWWRSGSRFGSGSPKSKIRLLRIGGGLCSLSIFLVRHENIRENWRRFLSYVGYHCCRDTATLITSGERPRIATAHPRLQSSFTVANALARRGRSADEQCIHEIRYNGRLYIRFPNPEAHMNLYTVVYRLDSRIVVGGVNVSC